MARGHAETQTHPFATRQRSTLVSLIEHRGEEQGIRLPPASPAPDPDKSTRFLNPSRGKGRPGFVSSGAACRPITQEPDIDSASNQKEKPT